jgi:hypothetical protein
MPIKQGLFLAIIAGLGITLQSCTETPTETIKAAKIEGRVVDKATSLPIEKALVKALPYNSSDETDADGKYALSIELPDTTSRTITLVISKAGFVKDSLLSLIIKNDRTTVKDIRLGRTIDSGQGSGDATNIVLAEVTTSRIFVKGSGGQATAKLTFEVRDANGIAIDTQHKVTVTFDIKGRLGGGESLNPTSAETDANGRAATTITSGTKAGALQILAEAKVKNGTISAAPVPIAIHGGLPDKDHFSLAFEKVNFAGWIYYGLENRITAFVGDTASNPVPPGTIVQFRCSGGIIGGSAVTDALGRASVILTSASPQPQGVPGYPFPFTEPGFARVIAETVNKNNVKITTEGPILFSGRTMPIEVTPTTFNLEPYAISPVFTYKVRDQNNNPLVAGTAISVTTDNGKVTGDVNVNLKDTMLREWTTFKFTLTNAQPDSVAKAATIKIEVISQNGDASTTIIGTMKAKQ